ncbi:hypothetical protein Clacol_009162 [Clathrus columnatus]|uniref:Nuclear pore complex protein NUP96 C-terminal domain-containing protein n=1 Tax=Clathrus columnatus TaxID=1419009 RepID=A0AAV5AME5_9AGAM|nr:hypothetical protein Clacol_009162 [Clathrus columnatus]
MARFGLTDDSDEEVVSLHTSSKRPEKGYNEEALFNREETQSTNSRVIDIGKPTATAIPLQSRVKHREPRGDAVTESEKHIAFAKEDHSTKYQRDGQTKKDTIPRGESKQPVRAVSGETTDDEQDYYHEDDYDEEEEAFQRRKTSAPLPSWPEQLGLEPHRLHVMQASLFRAPEEKERDKLVKVGTPSSKLLRKHSRSSEGDGLRPNRSERASFDKSLDPEPYRPARKVVRLQDVASFSVQAKGAYVDAGLSSGRSFRVSWGPGGLLARTSVSLGFVIFVFSLYRDLQSHKRSTVYVQNIKMVTDDEEIEQTRASKLLETQINHSVIELDDEENPIAFPARTLTFSTFSSLFPNHDNSHEAEVWRQGVALFDPINPITILASPWMKQRLVAFQRRTALADWLTAAVAPSIVAALHNDSTMTSAERAFTRLSGHQIEEATDAAMAEGNVHLAMLISQAEGDAEYRTDVENQLTSWAHEGADKLIHDGYRKCMALLAGVSTTWRPPSDLGGAARGSEINVVNGLDWKRAFGLMLWYGPGSESIEGFESALEQFERNLGRDGTPFPVLSYQKVNTPKIAPPSVVSTTESQAVVLDEADGSFELLRLAAAQIPLERAIYPRGFTESHLDYRMTWHTYILLSRAMRIKDFSDRQRVGDTIEEEPEVEGHSEIADNVTCAYATQLEALGQLQKAAFVLLHLEGSNGRKKALQDLLCRQAHTLEDWQIIGLQSLSIPNTWIEYALGCLAQYEGRTFDAYEHFLKADEQRMAHDIAVYDLAPEAVIKGDLALLRALFRPFDPQAVDDWTFRGKIFLDYADVMEKLPHLLAVSQENVVHDASEATEISRLKNLVPQLIRIIPDALRDRTDPRHRAALSEMSGKLLLSFDSIREDKNEQPDIESDFVDEANRLRHIHNTAYNRFLRAVSTVAIA